MRCLGLPSPLHCHKTAVPKPTLRVLLPLLPCTQALTLLMWSLAKLRHPCPRLLESACTTLLSRVQTLEPQQLAVALWATAHLVQVSEPAGLYGMGHLSLFRGVAQSVGVRCRELTPQGVGMVTWAFASVQVNPGKAHAHACALTLFSWGMSCQSHASLQVDH